MVKILSLGALLLTSLPMRSEQPQATQASPELVYLQGVHFAESGDAASAEIAFRKAWELDQANPTYIQGLTAFYIHNHQFSKALDILRGYVKRSGPTALGWTLQSELLFEQRQYDLAYQSLRSALDISSENYRAHELLGLIFSVYGKYSSGLEEMRVAAQQNPTSPQIRFYLGRLHSETGEFLAARDDFVECLKLKSDYPRALENLGLVYEALGDTSSALTLYRQAVDLEKSGNTPRSEYPYVCLGLLLEKQGQTTEAISLLTKGWHRNANSSWANFELGRLLFNANREDSAEYYLKRAETLDKNFAPAHYVLGKLYQKTSRSQEARTELSLFQELNKVPENRKPRSTPPLGEDPPELLDTLQKKMDQGKGSIPSGSEQPLHREETK